MWHFVLPIRFAFLSETFLILLLHLSRPLQSSSQWYRLDLGPVQMYTLLGFFELMVLVMGSLPTAASLVFGVHDANPNTTNVDAAATNLALVIVCCRYVVLYFLVFLHGKACIAIPHPILIQVMGNCIIVISPYEDD